MPKVLVTMNSQGSEIAEIAVDTLQVHTLQTLPTPQADATLRNIKSIEKKTFAASEAWDFSRANVFKPNTQVLCTFNDDADPNPQPVAYAVCTRVRKNLLLDKLCVAEAYRGRGIGKMLLTCIKGKAKAQHCRQIDLWVDENNHVARSLYQNSGFKEMKRNLNYYAPGRHAIIMTYEVDI